MRRGPRTPTAPSAAPRTPYPLVTTDVAISALVLGLVADADDDLAGGDRLVEQPQQHDLLLQRLQHRADRREVQGVARSGSRCRRARSGRCACSTSASSSTERERGEQAAQVAARRACGRSPTISGASASGRSRSRGLSVARSSKTASSGTGSGRSTTRCSTRPVSVMTTSISRVEESVDQLEVAHPRARQRRVLHHGDVAGQLGQRADGAVQHVVEVDGAVEERLDRPALGARQRLELGEPVDEQPVAGVGRDAAGAGVRLGDQALLLQHRHVVADRRRRHAQVVPVGQGLAAHGLVGGDEVLDDGAQDLELAVVASPRPVVLPLVRVPALSLERRSPSRRRRAWPRVDALRWLRRTKCRGAARDLQGGAGRSPVPRSRVVGAGLGRRAAPDRPARGADDHQAGARARPAARRGLDVLRRPVPARRPVAGRDLPRGRPAPRAARGPAEPAHAARPAPRPGRPAARTRMRRSRPEPGRANRAVRARRRRPAAGRAG